MMTWKQICFGIATTAGLTTGVRAQIPGAAPVAGVPAAASAVAAPAAAPPTTLWSFLGISKPQLAACKAQICASPFGQLLNNMTAPVTALSGGLVPGFCPLTPSPADLAKQGAEGMAAKVKADEADAKARRAAVRYLGTVDCHYWPEVQDALVKALRADRNECVRWEAAMALGRGCCCTKETMIKLSVCVSGSESDGNPSETSERVKAAAALALENCLSKLAPPAVPPTEPFGPPRERATPPRETPTAAAGQQNSLPVNYKLLEAMTANQVADQARVMLAKRQQKPDTMPTATPLRDRSLYGVLMAARQEANRVPQAGEAGTSVVYSAPVAPVAGAKVALAQDSVAPAIEPPVAVAKLVPYKTEAQARTEGTPVPDLHASAISEFPDPGATAVTLDQIMAVLQRSSNVEQREWAADNLAQVDWHENVRVLQALVFAAQQDSAPSVRLASVRCLVRMGANTPSVTAACQVLRYDPDNRVRQEAALALLKLGSTKPQSTMDTGMIRQIDTTGRN